MRIRFIVLLISVFSLIYVGYTQITAQDSVTCPGVIQSALDEVGSNCGGLDRNSACYGYNSVLATFSQPKPEDYFAAPSDRAGLVDLQGITTAPLDQTLNQWGVALLSVQANLPDTLPGQSVVFMVLGGTQVENAVAPEDAFQTAGTASVTLTIGADLYFEADFTSQVVGNVPMGTALTADAVSADGQWVRVVYQGTPGWVTRQVLGTEADLSALAVIGPNTQTPMQAFYFRTGIGGTECAEAPTSLIVQGPQNLTVDINANGADIRLSSTIALSALDVDPTTLRYLAEQYGDIGNVNKLLKIVVIDGHVVLNQGQPDELILETGETTFRCLSDPENLGEDGESNDREVIDACPWEPARVVTIEELEEFRDLEGLPLNYVIELPLDLPTLTPTPTNTPRPAAIFIPSASPIPTLEPTFTPIPTDVPPQPPPPTAVPPTVNPCDSFAFPANAPDIPTLIDAINHANDEACHPGQDTINLTGSGYYFSVEHNNTDGSNALPVISSAIAINGGGAAFGNSEIAIRYFYVSASGSLAINNLTIGNGNVPGFNGGNIYNAGSLSLTLVSLENGYANNGGSLFNAGAASFNRSAVIYSYADAAGGGIYNSGTLNMLNSTIGSNSTGASGGGLANAGGSAVLNFVTILQNTGTGGGGLAVSGGSVTTHNTIIAQNGVNCIGAVTASGANYADDTSCAGFTTDGNMSFGTLGGFPPSYQIYPFSQGVDAAACTTNSSAGVGEDQIGYPRPFAVTPQVDDCDSGAREWDGTNPP